MTQFMQVLISERHVVIRSTCTQLPYVLVSNDRVIAKSNLMALWLYGLTNKFVNWPVGAHGIRFAIGDKHQSVAV